MPELPEVEVTAKAIETVFIGQKITALEVFNNSLRWPVASGLTKLVGSSLISVNRRAKFLTLAFNSESVLCHLGMSGSFRCSDFSNERGKHDHILFHFGEKILLYNDPRRFGFILWSKSAKARNLLSSLGVEPLSSDFSGHYLKLKARKRRITVKAFIMNQTVVTGVGNIYASEALFAAKIKPSRVCNQISLNRYTKLATKIKEILLMSIASGGTTISDFRSGSGSAGSFQRELSIYGRKNEPCYVCGTPIKKIILSGRSSFFCDRCQS